MLQTKNRIGIILKIITGLVLVAGIVLRIYLYVQNRNLILDEANIARNIFERDFVSLSQRLDYDQYAPPLFLWMVKASTQLFGYGEYALRLYALLCGIVAMLLFFKLLKKLMPQYAVWYPLTLFAVGYMFLRYSSEVKQYMPDVLVTISLLLLAVSIDISKKKATYFMVVYTVAGTLAIWLSMPSVFILAGIGAYYAAVCVQLKEYKRLVYILLPGIAWFVQFVLYYMYILQPQASSAYLQQFHAPYFITANWKQNHMLLQGLLSVAGGHTAIAVYIHLAFIVLGIVVAARKNIPFLLLLLVPLCALVSASALRTFSLLDRVSLFIMPVLLLLIGYGLAACVQYAKHIALKGLVFIIYIINLVSMCSITAGYSYKREELSEGLRFVLQSGVKAEDVFVYHSSVPAFIYYTTIHPGRKEWHSLRDANRLSWNYNYDSLGRALKMKANGTQSAYIYTNCSEAQFNNCNNVLATHLQPVAQLDKPFIKAYIYRNDKQE